MTVSKHQSGNHDGRRPLVSSAVFPQTRRRSSRKLAPLAVLQIDPIFFIWIMAKKSNNKVLKKGQIVQEEDGAITVNLVFESDATMLQAQPHLEEIPEAVGLVMGSECLVRLHSWTIFP